MLTQDHTAFFDNCTYFNISIIVGFTLTPQAYARTTSSRLLLLLAAECSPYLLLATYSLATRYSRLTRYDLTTSFGLVKARSDLKQQVHINMHVTLSIK